MEGEGDSRLMANGLMTQGVLGKTTFERWRRSCHKRDRHIAGRPGRGHLRAQHRRRKPARRTGAFDRWLWARVDQIFLHWSRCTYLRAFFPLSPLASSNHVSSSSLSLSLSLFSDHFARLLRDYNLIIASSYSIPEMHPDRPQSSLPSSQMASGSSRWPMPTECNPR
jgi:hypothetical protein